MPKKNGSQFNVHKPREYEKWVSPKSGEEVDVRGMNKAQRNDAIRRQADKDGVEVEILD